MAISAVHTAFLAEAELNPLEPLTQVPLVTFQIGSWRLELTNHAAMVLTAMVLLLVFIPLATHSARRVPRGFQNLIESICVFLREDMARPILGHHTDHFMSFLWTLFFFILTLNLMALVPTERIVSLILGRKSHFGGPATANIYITGALAVIAFIMTHVSGIRQHGLFRYLAHLAPPAPAWLLPLIYPLEMVVLFVRPFTLAIRLFANIVAGHMVIATIIGLIFIFRNLGVAAVSVGVVVALSFLELLIAFIQAYIFTFLSALYISFSVSSEH
jgi:F-type H+-transporting ATPase subunit a